METTMQSSFPSIRSKIALIEAFELAGLGFALWCLGAIHAISEGESFFDQIIFFTITQGILLGSWAIYNGYIRIARAGGRIVDIGLWVIASSLTASYTLWAWSILYQPNHRIKIVIGAMHLSNLPGAGAQAGTQSMGAGSESRLRLNQTPGYPTRFYSVSS
jgi:hypothetical protein